MPARTVNDGYYVDGTTGEVVPVAANTTIMGADERDGYRRKAEQNAELRESILAQKQLCGDFYWTLFDAREEYYPEVSNSLLAKIVYLITYMDYETNLLVIQDSSTSPKRPMLKKDVANVIRLYRTKFNKFWTEMLATGIIMEEPDGKLRVSPLFCKGSLTRKNKVAMKVFTHAVRYMYENIDVRSHQYIAYLFRLIPYINLRYNVLCQNPLETNKSEIVRLTARDMCHILKIDDTHIVRFMKQILLKLFFVDINGSKQSVLLFLSGSKDDKLRSFVLVNPQFYAGYISKEEMLNILDEFEVKDNSTLLTNNM